MTNSSNSQSLFKFNFPTKLIVAVDSQFGIGKDGDLPWHIPADMKFYREKTTYTEDPEKQNLLIMGRKTWESIPPKYRPFKDRFNLILTKKENFLLDHSDVFVANSFDQIPDQINSIENQIESVFIIGGGMLFSYALKNIELTDLFVTFIEQNFDCDTYFPPIPSSFKEVSTSQMNVDNDIVFKFVHFKK